MCVCFGPFLCTHSAKGTYNHLFDSVFRFHFLSHVSNKANLFLLVQGKGDSGAPFLSSCSRTSRLMNEAPLSSAWLTHMKKFESTLVCWFAFGCTKANQSKTADRSSRISSSRRSSVRRACFSSSFTGGGVFPFRNFAFRSELTD